MCHAFVSRRGALRAALGGAGHVPPAAFEAEPAPPASAPLAAPVAGSAGPAPRIHLCGRRAASPPEPQSPA